ncbi:MAG TPA: carboxypeptidase-like regulatory domain-containing protein, partial [Gemmatimonadales bacterium]|nr:carboxypeptidase-like regulatory domain-containing protein [Gemmatimonadales bacterium]
MSRPAGPRALVALAWLLSVLPGAAAGQAPSRVSGRVHDAATGAPLAQAEVALGDLRTLTGGDGWFRFGSAPAGSWNMEVRRLG